MASKNQNFKQKQLGIKQNMAWNSFGSLTNLGCQWLMTILIVRLSNGYEAAGVFSLAAAVYGIFAPIAQYRMYTYQVSDVNNENTAGEYLAFRFITNAISLVLCMAYAAFTCSADALLAIFLYGVWKAIALVIDVAHACDQRHYRMDYIGKSLALQGVATLAVFVGVLLATGNLEATLAAMAAATLAIGLAYDAPRTRALESMAPHISREKALKLLKVCFPIVLAGILASATPSIPRQYLAWGFGDEMLGIYASIAAPVALIQMGASYVYNPLLGYFAEYHAEGKRKRFMQLLAKSCAAIAALGAACAIAFAFLGEPLLVLVFGESIRPHVYLLQPLVLLAVATGFLWFLNDLLIALRNFKGTFISCAVSFAIALGAMVPFIGTWNMNGVTFTGLAATAVGILIMGIFLVHQLKRN